MLQSGEALRYTVGAWVFHNLQNLGVWHFAEPPGRSKAALATPEAWAQILLDSAWSDIAIIITAQQVALWVLNETLGLCVLNLYNAMLNAQPIHLPVLQPA